MPTFYYKVKDSRGNTRTGTMEANDERQAAAMIREAGGFPMEIRLAKSTESSNTETNPKQRLPIRTYLLDPIWSGVNIRTLAFFYTQLQTLLNAGMSLSEALNSIGNRTHGRLKAIIRESVTHVQRGGHFSEVMIRYPRIFNRMQLSLFRAGEAGGLLEQMTARIADYLNHELEIRRMLAKIMFYPYAIFFFIVVTPHVPALFLSGGNAFFTSLWISLQTWLPIALIAIIALKYLFLSEYVRLMWDYVKIQPPVMGTMARKVAMSRFCRAFSSLYSAGMPIAESLTISADACANIAIGRRIKRAVRYVQSGDKLTDALRRTGAMTPIVMDMLDTGEKTGDMDVVLNKSADYMDNEVDLTIHKAGVLLFVVVLLIAAFIILQMVVKFYSGYFGNILSGYGQ
jgi:type II secretory pathway component PulF